MSERRSGADPGHGARNYAGPLRDAVPGFAVAAGLALVATLVAPFAPLLGAPIVAIVLGIVARSLRRPPDRLLPGIAFCARTVLQVAIVLSGFNVSLLAIGRTGLATLPVTLVTIALALALAPIAGRALRVPPPLRQLIGVGTAICGASAIAAVASVLEPAEADVALGISTIFLYNVVAVLAFPPLGHLLHLSQTQFGVWAGTAINDTSSVVAAGYSYGNAAGKHATIVKLTRATLILPLVGLIALLRARAERGSGKRVPWARIVPWFVVWFLAAAFVNSAGFVPAAWHAAIGDLSTFFISVALAAIGLQTASVETLRSGARPLALGGVLWAAVAISSLAVQRATGL